MAGSPEADGKLNTGSVGALTEYFELLRINEWWSSEKRSDPGWDDEDDITSTAHTDGVTQLVPVLLSTFACALVVLAVFFR